VAYSAQKWQRGNSVIILGYQIQDVQEWLGEQHETQRSLREVRHALLYHSDGHLTRLFVGATEFLIVCGFRRETVHQERAGVDRHLWNEPVRNGHARQAREECGHSKQHKVVMEARRLHSGNCEPCAISDCMRAHSKFIRARWEGEGEGETYGDVVVEEEEHPKDDTEWKCERDPLPVELPESHEPGAVMCGLERRADGER
jgi:hypothetical protein